jgi:hypothetical protein
MRTLSDVILALYSAVLEPDRLPSALDLAGTYFGARLVNLESFEAGPDGVRTGGVRFDSWMTDALLDRYEDFLSGAPNPRVAWGLDQPSIPRRFTDLDVMDASELRRHPFHQEVLRPWSIPYAISGCTRADASGLTGLVLNYDRLAPLRERQRLEDFDVLLQHVQVAESIARALRGSSRETDDGHHPARPPPVHRRRARRGSGAARGSGADHPGRPSENRACAIRGTRPRTLHGMVPDSGATGDRD